jgi:arylsulfatase A-like enzyme
MAKSNRPNIVFLLNDHQAYYRHGWDGGAKVLRPHFEKLAQEGIEFQRAYTATPLCGPARRTMLTGLYPHRHGEIKNDYGQPYKHEIYLDLLAEAGYRNFYYGKWHAGEGTALDHGCEGFNYTSYNNPYTKPEYKEYLKKHNLLEPEVLIEHNFANTWMEDEFGFGLSDGKVHRQDKKWCNEHASGILLTPKETHEAFFLADLAVEKLKELAASTASKATGVSDASNASGTSGEGQPFTLRVDFWGPHPPYFPTQEYVNMYNPADILEYGSFRDDLQGKPQIYHHENNKGISEDGELIIPNPLPWSEWQQVLSRCYAQITLMDEAAGRIIQALDEFGFADNTIVIWTTDHGDAVACHGGHFDKSAYMPEEVIRIPLAIRYPGHIPAGQVSQSLVSNIDYAPTMLDAAGLSFSAPVDGTSLLPLASGQSSDWRDAVVSETHGHLIDFFGRAFITDNYKYVYNEGDLDELYDLEQDPYELVNLIGDEKYREVHGQLERRFSEWQAASGDKRSK